jgi:hypothetical protein
MQREKEESYRPHAKRRFQPGRVMRKPKEVAIIAYQLLFVTEVTGSSSRLIDGRSRDMRKRVTRWSGPGYRQTRREKTIVPWRG